jgi:hypothetical protein
MRVGACEAAEISAVARTLAGQEKAHVGILGTCASGRGKQAEDSQNRCTVSHFRFPSTIVVSL